MGIVICVTERNMEALALSVDKKVADGYRSLGKPLNIGREAFVQRMVKIPLCSCGAAAGETGLRDRCAATIDSIAALNDCHCLPVS